MTSTADQLLIDFSDRTLSRARGYVRERRVSQIDADENAKRLSAQVRGTRKRPYAVTVDWSSGYAEGECSCPVGFDCKHAAAALLTFLQAGQTAAGKRNAALRVQSNVDGGANNQQDPALTQWLERLGRAGKPAPSQTGAGGNECLLYLLDLKTWPGLPCLRVTVCKARRRKDGSYGGVKQYDPRHALSGQVARFVQEVDLEMFYRLMQATRDNPSQYLLSHERNAKRLTPLLATGRCHWLTAVSPALRLGTPRAGRWQWQVDETGGQRLVVTSDTEIQALPLAPPWYVDVSSAECGPLRTEVPDVLAQTLLQSPRLDPAQVERLREQLAEHLPADLPRPREIVVDVRADSVPRPVLRLGFERKASWAWHGPMSGAWMELRFNYDGREIAAAERRSSLEYMQNDRLQRIERNSEAEHKACAALDGFVPYRGDVLAPELSVGKITFGDEEDDWLSFIAEDIPRLERDGWRIDVTLNFPLQSLSSNAFEADIEQGEDWFGLGLGIVVDGERVNMLPLLLEVLATLPRHARTPEGIDDMSVFPVPIGQGRTLAVPAARVKPILAALIELYDTPPLTAEGRLRLSRLDAARLADLDGIDGLRWQGGEALRALGEKLRNFNGIEQVNVPRGFRGRLRDYQRSGLDWLQFLRSYEFGGILADDMGLGKTIQTLAHLLVEKRAHRAKRPSLLVVPTSLVHNWCEEAARFVPSLRLLSLHGADRADKVDRIENHDLVLTTYPLLPRDAAVFKQRAWHYVILDEAQVVKNPRTKAARIVYALQSNHRLCLTGTPMENHLGELWSLFRFLMPGFLGDMKSFRRLYRTPIEKHGDAERRAHLARRVRPFLLRRSKDEVAAELPPKTDMVQPIELKGAQRDLYESVRLTMHKRIRDVVADKGFARSQIEILEALLKLRQVCCDPRLLKGSIKNSAAPSAKLERLMELLSGSLEDGRRVLLFSQFTEMLGLIERALKQLEVSYTKLTGRTRNRAAPIKSFQAGEVPLMLISLKAGGTGLNLTAADTVIHYDPWWNPAVEAQATDRAHRIGQDKPVFVYKLICAGTVEERIQALQQRKEALLQGVYSEGQKQDAALNSDDLRMLFEPLTPSAPRPPAKRRRRGKK